MQNNVWFSPLEQADGTVVGVIVVVDREDGFIEGAVNPSVPGAEEALWTLPQPDGLDAAEWLTAAASAPPNPLKLGTPSQASSIDGFEHATAREVLHWYLTRHDLEEIRSVIVGSLDRGIVRVEQ